MKYVKNQYKISEVLALAVGIDTSAPTHAKRIGRRYAKLYGDLVYDGVG